MGCRRHNSHALPSAQDTDTRLEDSSERQSHANTLDILGKLQVWRENTSDFQMADERCFRFGKTITTVGSRTKMLKFCSNSHLPVPHNAEFPTAILGNVIKFPLP